MPAPDMLDPAVERDLRALDAALAGDASDPALAAFVADVREARPAPAPAVAARLNGRFAAARAPRRRVRARDWLRGPAVVGLAVAAVAALLVVTTVLSAGGDGGSSLRSGRSASSAGGVSAAGDEAAPRAGADAGLAPAPTGMGERAPARKVERSAQLTLTTTRGRFGDVADRIVRATDAAGGYVLSSSIDTEDRSGGNATFELRVPVGRLEQTLAVLSRLAHVRDRSQSTQDITAQGVTARARLADARAERRALLRQLAAAASARETEKLHDRLRAVRREIEAARAAGRRVDNRAAFATISVSLFGTDAGGGAGNGGGRWTPGDAARDAVRVLEVAVGIALVGIAVLVPLGLLAVPAALLARWTTRRRREQALDAI